MTLMLQCPHATLCTRLRQQQQQRLPRRVVQSRHPASWRQPTCAVAAWRGVMVCKRAYCCCCCLCGMWAVCMRIYNAVIL